MYWLLSAADALVEVVVSASVRALLTESVSGLGPFVKAASVVISLVTVAESSST